MSNLYRAAGALFISRKTERIMLQLRSENTSVSGTWAFVGGMVRPDETIKTGLVREIVEEIGDVPPVIKTFPLDVYHSGDGKFNYYSVLVIVEDEFIPELNEESNGYCWVKIGQWPRPLHQGAYALLSNNNIQQNIRWALDNII